MTTGFHPDTLNLTREEEADIIALYELMAEENAPPPLKPLPMHMYKRK